MPQVTATVQVPITINWSQNGVAEGEQSVTAYAVVTRTVDDSEGWSAVGNWPAGQATAVIQESGQSSSSSSGQSSSSSSGG